MSARPVKCAAGDTHECNAVQVHEMTGNHLSGGPVSQQSHSAAFTIQLFTLEHGNEYRKRSRLRDTGMAGPRRDRTEVSYLECILGL